MEIIKGIHHFDCGPFNWYLIEENGRFTIVDAGFAGLYKNGLDSIFSLCAFCKSYFRKTNQYQ